MKKMTRKEEYRGFEIIITFMFEDSAMDLTDAQAFIEVVGLSTWEALLTSDDKSQIGWNLICLDKDAKVFIDSHLDKELTLADRLEKASFVYSENQPDEEL